MLNPLILVAAIAATFPTRLARVVAGHYILPVDNLPAIKMSLSGYSVYSQTMRFSIPFPDSPWGANSSEYLQLELGVGTCETCFDVVFEGPRQNPEPRPKHLYHPYTQDSSGAIHIAEITISGEFPEDDDTTTSEAPTTGNLHLAIISVDSQPLEPPLAFSVIWNLDKPTQRLGGLAYKPARQVIEFAEHDEFPGDPRVPPLMPNGTCEPVRAVKLIEQDQKTQRANFAVTCEGCFPFTVNTPNSLIFSLQPQPQTQRDHFAFVINGKTQSLSDQGWGIVYEGGSRIQVQAPDEFDVTHTLDMLLRARHVVVEGEYSELGSIDAVETFRVDFSIILIDGHPPAEQISFAGEWDVLHRVDTRRIPRWESLVMGPMPIRFPRPKGPLIYVDSDGPRRPLGSGPRVPSQYGPNSLTFDAFLMFVGFVAGIAIPRRPRRRG
ncbi:hypothetical protein FOPE_10345 [Fonsecaea pedrosoi]|nr:hypothetical protein FOPE_10345 [Fonsecaea pedrosoi]